jgi:hypothetical protein
MAAPYDFPSLAPVARRYGLGVYPVTIETGWGGGNVRFLHGTTRHGISMELSYENLTQAETKLIRDHYRLQDGGHQSFLLPSTVWAGQSDVTNIAPTGTRWKYASVPEETHKSGGYVDITVSLLSVR